MNEMKETPVASLKAPSRHSPSAPSRRHGWRSLFAGLLSVLTLASAPVLAQKAGTISIPVPTDPQNDPVSTTVPVMKVTRTPAVLVAGQPFTIVWNTTTGSAVDVFCNNPAGGFINLGAVTGTSGTVTGLASSLWAGRTFDCTWTASNGMADTSFIDHVSTTGQGQPAGAVNNARVVSQSMPASMNSGQSYAVNVTLQNTGTSTWVAGEYKLGAQNPQDTATWGVQRVELTGNVAPGANASFNFTVKAPTVSGNPVTVNLQWGMLQEYVQWFGPFTSNVAVNVIPPPAPVISVTRTPATLTAGQSYTLQWSATNATTLTRVCTASGTGYVDNSTLATSGSVTATASSAWVGYPSTCTWTAGGPGGSKTLSETVTTSAVVVALPTVSVTRNPTPLKAGQGYTVQWSTTNATALTRVCTASGTGYVDNSALATSGSASGTASSAWVAYPSTCIWTATGPGGSKTLSETVTTSAVVSPLPTISVTRNPSPLKAGQAFTLQWSSTDATSVTRVCTSTGSGYTDNSTLGINGSDSGTASATWVGFPSSLSDLPAKTCT